MGHTNIEDKRKYEKEYYAKRRKYQKAYYKKKYIKPLPPCEICGFPSIADTKCFCEQRESFYNHLCRGCYLRLI